MPIQVLQRENTTDQSFQSYADRVQKQQQMDQDYSIKLASLKQLEMDFKLKSKMAESEMSKREFDTKAAQTANYFAMLNWARQHYEDPEQRMKAVSTITGNHGKESYGDLFKSPEFSTMVKNMSLSPEERQQSGAGAKSMAEANVLSQIRIPGMEGGPQAPDSPMSPQDVNAPRAGAVGGNVPGGGPVLTGANIGGFNIGFPEGAATMTGATHQATLREDAIANAAPALAIVDELENAWSEAFKNAPKTGSKFIQGTGDVVGGSWLRQNDAIRSYLTTKSALLTKMARGLGEKGVITDKDVARVNQALADAYTNKNTAKKNFGVIRNIISSGFIRYAKGGSVPEQSAVATPITPEGNDPLGIFGGR